MTWTKLLAVAAALCLAGTAQAAPVVQPIPDSDSIDAIGCSGTTCLLATGSIDAQTAAVSIANDGNAGALQIITDVPVLFAAACASPADCFAVGGNTDNGQIVPVTNGSAGATIDAGDTHELHTIACAGDSVCFAGGNMRQAGSDQLAGALVTITNGQPSAARAVDGTSDLIDISCPSAAGCVAVALSAKPGGVPGFVDIAGGIPDDFQPVATNGGVGLNRIACGAPGRCVGVNVNQAMALTDGRPGAWNRVVAGDGVDAGFTDIDCWSATRCVGTGGSFPAVIPLSGSAAGVPLTLDGLGNVTSVACPTSAACYAGGQTQSADAPGGALATIPTGDLQFPATPAAPKPKPCVLPKLRGLTLAKAKKKIKAGGCRVGKIRRRSAAHARGRVISQHPRKGRYAAGKKVSLVVGR